MIDAQLSIQLEWLTGLSIDPLLENKHSRFNQRYYQKIVVFQ